MPAAKAAPGLMYPGTRVVRAFRVCVRTKRGICQWNLLAENPAPQGRNSLAQHVAEGGVLGRVVNRFESLQRRHSSHAPLKAVRDDNSEIQKPDITYGSAIISISTLG